MTTLANATKLDLQKYKFSIYSQNTIFSIILRSAQIRILSQLLLVREDTT